MLCCSFARSEIQLLRRVRCCSIVPNTLHSQSSSADESFTMRLEMHISLTTSFVPFDCASSSSIIVTVTVFISFVFVPQSYTQINY